MFKSQAESAENSHITMFPHIHSLPHHQHPAQSGTSVAVDEPTLIHDHPKSIVYIRGHICHCTFYGFGQMSNDMYPLL